MKSIQRLEELFSTSFESREFEGTTFIKAGKLANTIFKDSTRAEGIIYNFAGNYADITGKSSPLKILLDDELVRGTESVLRQRIASWKTSLRIGTDYTAKQLAWRIWVPVFWAVNTAQTMLDAEFEIEMAIDQLNFTGKGFIRFNGNAKDQLALVKQLDIKRMRTAIQATPKGFILVFFDATRIIGVQSLGGIKAPGFEKLIPEAIPQGNFLPLYVKQLY